MAGLAASANAAIDPPEMRIGLASFSLNRWSRAEAIEIIKQLPVRNVNIKENHLAYTSTLQELEAGRAEFEAAGLTITGGGTIPLEKNDVGELRRYFEYAKASRLPVMVVASTKEIMPKVEKLVQEYDIRIALHNHGPTSKDFPTPQSAYDVVKGMDRRCGLCIDVGHTARYGANVLEQIAATADRLFEMHMWDMKSFDDSRTQCDVGEGRMPIAGIFKLLRKLRFRGNVNLEQGLNRTKDRPVIQLAKSLAYMNGTLAGVSA